MKFAIFGSSRGLGREVVRQLAGLEPLQSLFLLSRKEAMLGALKDEVSSRRRTLGLPQIDVQLAASDFTRRESQESALNQTREFGPTHILYCAGGGPFGQYEDLAWKDHLWSLELCLLFPAKLLHFSQTALLTRGLRQLTFVGSQIAERNPDPKASSYAAAKHGLYGLISSVVREGAPFDLRLYSPGYMDTEMLPKGAPPRQSSRVVSPDAVAQDLVLWLMQDKSTFHRTTDSI